MSQKFLSDSKTKIGVLLVLLVIFNVMFPKAGFKTNDIPITLGNLLLALSLVLMFIKKISINKIAVLIFANTIFWLFRLLLPLINNKVRFSEAIGYIVPLCFYPLVYIIFISVFNSESKLERVIEIIKWCVLFVMAYTVIQYIFGIGNIAIPGLTVNYSDYISNPSGWWLEKSNAFSDISKMVSTYQNGNLLGINLLLLYPLTFYSIKSAKARYFSLILFVISVLLAGSRTMYVSCLLFLCIFIFYNIAHNKKFSRKSMLNMLVIIIAFVIVFAFVFNKLNNYFIVRILTIFDSEILASGTGRIPGALKYFNWAANEKNILIFVFGGYGLNYSGGAYEMTYMCIFILGGIVGLILFALPIATILINSYKYCNANYLRSDNITNILKGTVIGLVLFLIAAFAEGGFWLPPTAVNLWMLLAIATVAYNLQKNGN